MTPPHLVTCPECAAKVERARLAPHQRRAACRVKAWKGRMERDGYVRIDHPDALYLAVEVQDDLRWAHEPALRGPSFVDSEDPHRSVSAVWWPAWCDFLFRSPPLVVQRDVHDTQVQRIRSLVGNPRALKRYKERVRRWRLQGIDPEERFRIWPELETFYRQNEP